MRHKPILFKKIAKEKGGTGRETIGLIGTHHGVGVTHTGLMLAFYMGEELGKRTAILECNGHHDMSRIQNAYEWSVEEAFSFTFQRITCYKEVTRNRIATIFGEDYECIILDFGTDLITNKEEFLRCHTKIVIGGRSEWDKQKLCDFVKASETIRGSDTWQYFIPQVSDQTKEKIKNEVKRKVWAVPCNEEPTLPSRSTDQFFDKVFRS